MIQLPTPPIADPAGVPDLTQAGIDLLIALVLAWVLGWHFVWFGQVLSPKRKFARVLVFISATTLLIISVVKASVALSLGLVGALSIIRFRTPIKEPEELAYLFLAVAIGVGLGAGRRYETVYGVVAILLAMAMRRPGTPRTRLSSIVQIECAGSGPHPDVTTLLAAVSPHCTQVDLRRVDTAADVFRASLSVEVTGPGHVPALLAQLRAAAPGAQITIVDRATLE